MNKREIEPNWIILKKYISGLIYESKELEKHRLKQKLLSFRGETCGGAKNTKKERER